MPRLSAPLIASLLTLCAPLLWPTPLAATLQDPAAGAEVASPAPATLSTVILVRHAEKGTDDPRDPTLNEAGLARAAALAELLGGAGVTHLFASEYRRTQDTLAPLAAALGLEVAVHPARDGAGLAGLVGSLPAGSVAVVAGHSNTIPALARALGVTPPGLIDAPGGAVMDEGEYGRVFVITHAPGAPVAPRLMELRGPRR